MVADGAKRAGCRVTVLGLKGFAEPSLADHVDRFCWTGVGKLGRWIRIFRRNQIHSVIMAGSVRKSDMYGRFYLLRLMPDLTSIKLWFFKIKDRRNDTVLAAVADELANHGIIMKDCIEYTQEHMAPEGVLTRTQPTESQVRDAQFGWTIAKEMGRLDIGQSVAVKDTDVIAVEAIEGTDRMIERAGQLCKRGGWTMIKVAKPDQDMRFDVPTIGPDTIANLKKNGAKMLVIEAGKTVIVEREQTIADAEKAGIIIQSIASV